eukprot:5513397-Amphidinium_carterae.1
MLGYNSWPTCLGLHAPPVLTLHEKPFTVIASADLSSDLKVAIALHRRGLALHVAGAITWPAHKDLVNKLLMAYLTDPPVGCWRTQLSQLEQADQHAFEQLQMHTRQGLDSSGHSVFPVDAELRRIITTAAFELRLTPLRQAVANSEERPAKLPRTEPTARAKSAVAPASKPASSTTNATRSSPRSASTTPAAVPDALKAHVVRTSKGQPICWNYNLGSCQSSRTKAGQRCSRGWHVCCFRMANNVACEKAHPLQEHVHPQSTPVCVGQSAHCTTAAASPSLCRVPPPLARDDQSDRTAGATVQVQDAVHGALAASAGRQLRGSRHPIFMPKFAKQCLIPRSFLRDADFQRRRLSSDCLLPGGEVIPIRARPLSFLLISSGVSIGISRTPEEYVALALTKNYPGDLFEGVDQDVHDLVGVLASSTPTEVVLRRLKHLHDVQCVVKEVELQQQEEFAAMTPEVRRVMHGKQTVAIRLLANAVGISDPYFEQGLIAGFRLDCDVPAFGRGERRVRDAGMSKEDWNESATLRRDRILQQIGPTGDCADHTLWTVTMQECDAGWLSAPLRLRDAKQLLGKHYVPAKRFLVAQKGKDRPVDDYTISGANDLVKDLRLREAGVDAEVCGKSVDLDSAFRQLAVHPSSAYVASVALWNPLERKPVVMMQHALPFESVVSVHAFCRLSEIIRHFLVRFLMVVASAYFDDFGPVDAKRSCSSASFVVEGLLSALGIRFSLKESKRRDALFIKVVNTKERAAEIKSDISGIIKAGVMSGTQAARLRGRLGFFISSSFSRAGALFLRALEL